MNIFLNEYFGFCFELNFELNHFWAKFNEKMNFQNVSNRASHRCHYVQEFATRVSPCPAFAMAAPEMVQLLK